MTVVKPKKKRSKVIRKLLAEAQRGHSEYCTIAGKALEVAKRVGDALNKLKRLVRDNGDKWEPWCKANFEASMDTAQDYMRVARKWDELKPHFDKDPTLSLRGALRILRWLSMKVPKQTQSALAQLAHDALLKLRHLAVTTLGNGLRRWADEDLIYFRRFFEADLEDAMRDALALLEDRIDSIPIATRDEVVEQDVIWWKEASKGVNWALGFFPPDDAETVAKSNQRPQAIPEPA